MAQVRIDIGDDADGIDGLDRFCRYNNYEATITQEDGDVVPNPISKKSFARQCMIDYYNNIVVEQTNRDAIASVQTKGTIE